MLRDIHIPYTGIRIERTYRLHTYVLITHVRIELIIRTQA
jgi:hypothetical protein